MSRRWILAVGAALLAATLHATAQQPPAAQPAAPQPAPRQQPGVFPAMQRPPADPAVIERGKGIFGVIASPATAPTRAADS